jgi:hypothetical protein
LNVKTATFAKISMKSPSSVVPSTTFLLSPPSVDGYEAALIDDSSDQFAAEEQQQTMKDATRVGRSAGRQQQREQAGDREGRTSGPSREMAGNTNQELRKRHASRDRLGNSEYVRVSTYEVSDVNHSLQVKDKISSNGDGCQYNRGRYNIRN